MDTFFFKLNCLLPAEEINLSWFFFSDKVDQNKTDNHKDMLNKRKAVSKEEAQLQSAHLIKGTFYKCAHHLRVYLQVSAKRGAVFRAWLEVAEQKKLDIAMKNRVLE